jgi:DNA repair protein RadC
MNKQIDKKIGPAGHRRRFRERFLTAGRKALVDYELIELLLTYSIPPRRYETRRERSFEAVQKLMPPVS